MWKTVGIASIVVIGTFAIASTERLKTSMQMDVLIIQDGNCVNNITFVLI